jgi:hypothetical protein
MNPEFGSLVSVVFAAVSFEFDFILTSDDVVF